MNNIKTFGFIPSIIENDHYVLGDGSLVTDILMPGGHGWKDYLPSDQFQSKSGLETENCTSYGTLHALATLGNKKFGVSFQKQLSERYLGIVADTGVTGNDPHHVAECIRLGYGVLPEVYLPFGPDIQTWNQYYSPKPISYKLFSTGNHWTRKYKFQHEWVTLPNDPKNIQQEKMKYALQFSPLGASGFAWGQHADGLYYSDQSFQNHWFEIYDYVDGVKWLAFDSYDNTHKELDWNYTFGQVKRYHLDYQIGGELLGDMLEQVYLGYTLYLASMYFKSILK